MRRTFGAIRRKLLTTFTPLRYTPVHEQYVALAETELQAGLLEGMGGGFDIVEFLSKVPAWVERGEVTDDEASSEPLEVLTSFTSFESFKELMLARKAEKEGGGGAAVFGDVSREDDMEALVASMSSAAWKPVKRMKTMVLERAKDEKGGESCRFVLEAPIPPEHGLLLMLGEEREQPRRGLLGVGERDVERRRHRLLARALLARDVDHAVDVDAVVQELADRGAVAEPRRVVHRALLDQDLLRRGALLLFGRHHRI